MRDEHHTTLQLGAEQLACDVSCKCVVRFTPTEPFRRLSLRRALSRMPPLPAEVPGLEQVTAVLQEELQLADRRKRLAQLADSLQHDSLEVR